MEAICWFTYVHDVSVMSYSGWKSRFLFVLYMVVVGMAIKCNGIKIDWLFTSKTSKAQFLSRTIECVEVQYVQKQIKCGPSLLQCV